MPSSSDNGIVNSRAKSDNRPGPCGVSVSQPLMSSGVNMNVNSAQCWRTLSDQGITGKGTDTCLILVIVREWIQPRFRCGVVTAGHSSFLPTLLSSELVVETVVVATRSKGSISPNSPLSGHSNPSYQACTSVPNTSKSNLPLPVGCPYSRRSSQST